MSRRIEIELTSARQDGTWTWRAAGAREPKGVVESSILPGESKVGDVYRADVEIELDGSRVLSVAPVKGKSGKSGLLQILPSNKPFEAVTSQLAGRSDRGRNDRGDRGDRRDRPPRRPDGDRPPRTDGDRRPRQDGDRPRPEGGDRPGSDRPGSDRPGNDRRPRRDGDRAARPAGESGPDRRERRPRPNFTPPPELPQRPKPKRLKPGRTHRNAILAELPESQRAVAERALQGGVPAVRQAVIEQNVRLKAEGKEEIPAAGLIQMAEQLLPKLRVAEWLDRAAAAKADIAELALPDLRSVVASSEDPVVARDETTRELAAELKLALASKQESELLLWLDDITAALGVGRVIRALKLSSQPPKAGVRFPAELATRLAGAATASLTADALPDRWSALLEAAAFAPCRSLIKPTAAPTQSSDELAATVKRVAPALPQIAALFGIEVAPGAAMPKPMRPTRPNAPAKKAAPAKAAAPPRPPKADKPGPAATPAALATAAAETPASGARTADEAPAAVEEATIADNAPAAEAPTADEASTIDKDPAESPAAADAPTADEAPTIDEDPAESPAAADAPTADEAPTIDKDPAESPAAAEAPAAHAEAPAADEADETSVAGDVAVVEDGAVEEAAVAEAAPVVDDEPVEIVTE